MKRATRIVFVCVMAAAQLLSQALLAFPAWDWTQARAYLQKEDYRELTWDRRWPWKRVAVRREPKIYCLLSAGKPSPYTEGLSFIIAQGPRP